VEGETLNPMNREPSAIILNPKPYEPRTISHHTNSETLNLEP
jgi:hypothetical protein